MAVAHTRICETELMQIIENGGRAAKRNVGAVLAAVTLVGIALMGPLLMWEWRVRCLLAKLREAEHFQERSDVLSAIWRLPARQRVIVRLFDGWGRDSETYDVGIVEVIEQLASDTSVRFDNNIIGVICSRVGDDATLLQQVYWHGRWEREQLYLSMPIASRKRFDEASEATGTEILNLTQFLTECNNRPATSKILWLIRAASMLDKPEAIRGVTLETVDAHISALVSQMRRENPFYFFDESTGTFRVDKCAYRLGLPVNAARQRASRPRFHLPLRSEWRH